MDLERKGLVQLEPDLRLTERGLRYLQEYRRILQFLEQFGLTERESVRQSLPVERPVADPDAETKPRKRSDPTAPSHSDKS